MTAPTKSTLPLVGSGSWYNTPRDYRLESSQSTSTSVFYELYYNGVNSDGGIYGLEIKDDNKMYVTTSNNTGAPDAVAVGNFVSAQTSVTISNGDTVSLYTSSGGLLAQINVDTTMLWTSSGAGGLGGTVYVQIAKVVDHGVPTGLRFEQRGFVAGSYELTGPGGPYTWTLSSQSNNLQHHIGPLLKGTYYLYQDAILYATIIAGGKRKVHCNFW